MDDKQRKSKMDSSPEIFSKEKKNMQCGEVYRLVKSDIGKDYVGKLFIFASTNVSKPDRGRSGSDETDFAVCLEDGFAFYGWMSGAEFIKAEAKLIDLSPPFTTPAEEKEEELPF